MADTSNKILTLELEENAKRYDKSFPKEMPAARKILSILSGMVYADAIAVLKLTDSLLTNAARFHTAELVLGEVKLPKEEFTWRT